MKVEFWRTTEMGGELAGVVTLDENDEAVVSATMPPLLRRELLDGIEDEDGDDLTVADGAAFLEALPALYSGSMLRARLVEDDD